MEMGIETLYFLQIRLPLRCNESDLFSYSPVQGAKVVVHFSKVGKQLASEGHELLKTILYRRIVQKRNVTRGHTNDFSGYFVAAPIQLSNAGILISVASFAYLFKQFEQS